MKVHWGFLSLFLSALILSVGWGTYFFVIYQNSVYVLDIAEDWMWRARASTDLNAMATYMNKTLEVMEPFHGNPCWWFPTPDTNFDYIKTNIQECRVSAESFQGETGSMAYQQLVQNLQETILEIEDHLNLTEWWLWWPSLALSLFFYVSIALAVVIIFMVTIKTG